MFDHCRIGSLEKQNYLEVEVHTDHCRIGSLENAALSIPMAVIDHCRIGSLEIYDFTFVCEVT